MLFTIPKLSRDSSRSSFDLLQDALSVYGVTVATGDGPRELKSLKMDDIDFVEAVQLVETAISAKIDKKGLGPSTDIDRVVGLIDQARDRRMDDAT